MGANAQTSVPAFTTGQVLTAAQMTEVNTGIPVFANSAARDAAFGGTGEKTLAEGQFAFLEDTNATQFYDGAAWQPVGVAPALILIKTEAVGTTVSSVNVTSAFSATYDNYLITYNNFSSSSSGFIRLQLGATTSGYKWGSTGNNFNGTANNSGSTTAGSFEQVTYSLSATGGSLMVTVRNPFLAKQTETQSSWSTGGSVLLNMGLLENTTSYTDFTIIPTTGTLTGGTIRVYGYANS
jgi:hypothetical protein